MHDSPDFRVIFSFKFAIKSTPEDPEVLYSGISTLGSSFLIITLIILLI